MEGEIETGKRYIETDFNKLIEIKERDPAYSNFANRLLFSAFLVLRNSR